MILMSNNFPMYFILISFALGELIDRIEFYNELNVPEPKDEFYLH
jgi:hypothetical protein